MFTGAREKKREMDWQLVASYFTVKFTDYFCSAAEAPAFAKMWDFCASGTLQYTSTCNMILLRLSRCCHGVVVLVASKGASTTLLLRQRISNYASFALTTMQLRLCYDRHVSAGAVVMLRLCCALKPLLCNSADSRSSSRS